MDRIEATQPDYRAYPEGFAEGVYAVHARALRTGEGLCLRRVPARHHRRAHPTWPECPKVDSAFLDCSVAGRS